MRGWIPSKHETNSKRDDFESTEDIVAGYLMGELNMGHDLKILGGVRYEHYNSNYDANFVYVLDPIDGYGAFPDTLNSVNHSDDHFFPNAQLRYRFTDWADFRLALTKAISRPDYTAASPGIYIDPSGLNLSQIGNSNLKPAIATNYDAYLSFYTTKLGFFTLGGFYKKIDDVSVQTDIYYPYLQNYTTAFPGDEVWNDLGLTAPSEYRKITTFLNNPEPAFKKGFELDWQTIFWYLPEPLNYMSLEVNYTHTWSDMDYKQIENKIVLSGPRGIPIPTVKDTIRNARILYQPDHILNIIFGADHKGFSGRISFILLGDMMTYMGSRPEEDQFTKNIYKWDFSLQQRLPLEGFSIIFSGINIFHNRVTTFQKFRRTIDGKIMSKIQSYSYSPRVFQLKLRYNM